MKSRLARLLLVVAAIAMLLTLRSASADEADGPCTDLSRDCMVEVALTYIDAQADSSRRAGARVAPDVRRWENGILNATSAEDIRGGSTESDEGLTAMLEARDTDRVFVDRNQAIFFWKMDVKDPITGGYHATAHITERFQIEADRCGDEPSPCITEIEAIFCIGRNGREEAMPEQRDRVAGAGILCHRQG